MRVLMLTTTGALIDGINRHILAVSKGLKNCGLDVAVCIVHSGGDLSNALNDAGIKVYTLECKNGHDIRLLWRFCSVMRSFRPDIVHVHVLALLERIVLAVFFRSVHKVVTIHGIVDPVLVETVRQKMERWVCKLVPLSNSHEIFISIGVRKYYKGIGPVIYNPIEVPRHKASHKLHDELGLSYDVPILGTACRFAEVKQPLVFVEVMCRVLEQIPKAHAVLIGDGDESIKQGMKAKISQSRLDDRIHWLGYRTDAPELVGELDMFIMTSKREGMPTALLEAMAQWIPVAFLKGDGGLMDLVAMDIQYGGIAIIAESAENLARGIINSLGQKIICRKMVDRARAVVDDCFSLDSVVLKLTSFYNQIT